MSIINYKAADTVVAGGPSPIIWADVPVVAFLKDPGKGIHLFENFLAGVVANDTKPTGQLVLTGTNPDCAQVTDEEHVLNISGSDAQNDSGMLCSNLLCNEAIKKDSGRKLWSRDMSSHSGLDVASGDAVYVTDDDGYVWALQDGSGDALWRQTRLLRRKGTAPVIVGSNVIVGDLEGYVHWISRQDGHFVARLHIADNPIRSKPIVKDGLVFITATDGTLTALRVQ